MEPNLAWLEDPQVFRVNRLDAHSDHHFYESTEDMKAGKETLRQSLNGTWKFAWSEKPSDRPADFYREEADLTSFGEIRFRGILNFRVMIRFTISIPCIHGKGMYFYVPLTLTGIMIL